MIIHWTPCFDHRPISWTQPETDRIIIHHVGKTIALDLSESAIVEYEIPPEAIDYIHRAWREGGVLHLQMPSYGPLREDVTIDHGEEKEITWRKR